MGSLTVTAGHSTAPGPKGRSPALRAVGLYWHFVDIVWLAVFLTVYVRPHLA